ncbi:MAG TPA: hypothetical protein VEK15_06505 [Vicinamibacteria bacterium]|nr:hypothetical protein [Vicinamibacteria bacterium]
MAGVLHPGGIVNDHRGILQIESEEGKGPPARIVLPLEDARTSSAGQASAEH